MHTFIGELQAKRSRYFLFIKSEAQTNTHSHTHIHTAEIYLDKKTTDNASFIRVVSPDTNTFLNKKVLVLYNKSCWEYAEDHGMQNVARGKKLASQCKYKYKICVAAPKVYLQQITLKENRYFQFILVQQHFIAKRPQNRWDFYYRIAIKKVRIKFVFSIYLCLISCNVTASAITDTFDNVWLYVSTATLLHEDNKDLTLNVSLF